MRSNYPETYNYLKAKKARHPRDDAIEDFTEWTLMGTKADLAAVGQIPKPGASLRGEAPPAAAEPPKKEETEEEYVSRRCEEYMHKTLSSRCARANSLNSLAAGYAPRPCGLDAASTRVLLACWGRPRAAPVCMPLTRAPFVCSLSCALACWQSRAWRQVLHDRRWRRRRRVIPGLVGSGAGAAHPQDERARRDWSRCGVSLLVYERVQFFCERELDMV